MPHTRHDIAYGSHPRQKLDLYLPRSGSVDTVVVFIHGGSWVRGDKRSYAFVGRALARDGWAAAVINYRLSPEVAYPAFVEDAALACRWLSRELGTVNIVVMGHSAGGHTAAALALDPQYQLNLPLAGMIGLAGGYDVRMSPTLKLPSILSLVQRPKLPLLLLHGKLDPTVPFSQSVQLAELVRKQGGRSELELYPYFEHMAILLPFLPGLFWVGSLRSRIRQFIQSL